MASLENFRHVAFDRVAQVAQPRVALQDVADLSGLPCRLQALAAPLTIAVLPRDAAEVRISINRIEARVAALLPASSSWFADRGGGEILIQMRPQSRGQKAPDTGRCLAANKALNAGAAAAVADFSAADCDAAHLPARAFRFDAATGSLRIARQLRAMERVAAPPQSELAAVMPGDRLFVAAAVGSVKIERQVQAVQPAPAGRALFVKAQDGAIFSAPAPGVAP